MDIIYADIYGDIGILSEYQIDLAYGRDENNFVITMPLRQRELSYGYFIYSRDDANIGGIIDDIEVKSESRQILYKGRTWHGIMAEKIVEPANGQDYFTVAGDANSAIASLINQVELDNFFVVSSVSSGITIAPYQTRYGDLYSTLLDMLSSNYAKLKLDVVYVSGYFKIELSAVPYADYYADDEWSNSNRDFDAEHCENPINHIICLGRGNLKDRKVIHLFSDGVKVLRYIKKSDVYQDNVLTNYTVIDTVPSQFELPEPNMNRSGQLYGTYRNEVFKCERLATSWQWVKQDDLEARPSSKVYEDSDYILDKGMRYYGKEKERAIVYDYPNAEVTENYVIVDSKPSDWNDKYWSYYRKNNNGYASIEADKVYKYLLLTSQPDDWVADASRYFTLVDGQYTPVELVEGGYVLTQSQPADWNDAYGTYFILEDGVYNPVQGVNQRTPHGIEASQVADWNTNYSNYYTRTYDGVQWVYTAVSSVSEDRYMPQMSKPSDWFTNYGNYYERFANTTTGQYEWRNVQPEYRTVMGKSVPGAPQWKLYKYSTKYTINVAPPTSNYGTVYYFTSETVAPTWWVNRYYDKDDGYHSPTWQENTYYEYREIEQVPAFGMGIYEKKEDNFKALVENGIKKFTEYLQRDKISITLNPIEQYDIGDIVGAKDEVTGLTVVQAISKKIFKLTGDRVSISYETGG